MKYSVIIPTYNHCNDLLKPCIDSLLKFSKISDIELIVSANGCNDNTLSYLTDLKEKYDSLGMDSNFKFVWNDNPLGYSGACNEGIKVATTDYIVLLSNDVIFLPQYKNEWLDLLEKQFDMNSKCGISCVIKGFSQEANREFAVFFLVMIHRKVFDNIGLLNTDYGVGSGEDIEFSIEAENAGYEVCIASELFYNEKSQIYTGKFPVYHKGEGTVHDTTLVPNWSQIFNENKLKISKKYGKSNLTFLEEQHKEIYDEIIRDNCYRISEELIKDKTVIDIGANIGVFSLLASKLGAKKVYAVEPVSNTFSQLCRNINKSTFKNIVPMKNVVSDKPNQSINISLQNDIGHNSLYIESKNSETVSTITLNEILKDCDNDVFLKIDCEGAEYDILLNASDKDMQKINNIAMELHGDLHPKYKGFDIMHNKLKEFGFKLDDKIQMYAWDLNEKKERINYRELPTRVEIWKR